MDGKIPGFTDGTAEVNGQTIAYSRGGEGPPLLLLHGFPQTRAMWRGIAGQLARDHTVITADLRGYGDSSAPVGAGQMTFRKMAADQVALMEALGFGRFHLAGHDRGARTAHRLGLDHGERLLSLALMTVWHQNNKIIGIEAVTGIVTTQGTTQLFTQLHQFLLIVFFLQPAPLLRCRHRHQTQVTALTVSPGHLFIKIKMQLKLVVDLSNRIGVDDFPQRPVSPLIDQGKHHGKSKTGGVGKQHLQAGVTAEIIQNQNHQRHTVSHSDVSGGLKREKKVNIDGDQIDPMRDIRILMHTKQSE